VTVEVFGIRHHGPGSARSLVVALTDYQPDAVLIEGPADADPLLRWVLADGMTPPLALLAYAPDRPQTAAFWPYAAFSPEWQAMIYAMRHDIEVGFCDLPAASMLARWSRRPSQDDDVDEPDDVANETPSPPPLEQHDPLAILAEAAGYDDPERWWDDLVESRLDASSPFPMITDAMAELRMIMAPGSHDHREARREDPRGPEARSGTRCGGLRCLARARTALAAAAGCGRYAYPPRRTATQDHRDLGAMDPSAARLSYRLRCGRRLARLVPPSLGRSRSTDRALVGQSCAGAAYA
jgi:hypothetical protein